MTQEEFNYLQKRLSGINRPKVFKTILFLALSLSIISSVSLYLWGIPVLFGHVSYGDDVFWVTSLLLFLLFLVVLFLCLFFLNSYILSLYRKYNDNYLDEVKRSFEKDNIEIRRRLDEELNKKRTAFFLDLDRQKKKWEEEKKTSFFQYEKRLQMVMDKENLVKKKEEALNSKNPFKMCASIRADLDVHEFVLAEKNLKHKPHPGVKSADELKKYRLKARKCIALCKEMEYKYEFMLETFPELRNYVDEDADLLSVSNYICYDELSDTYDRVRDYVSKTEWLELDEVTKNQLALDNYNKRAKSNWVIGVEYELFCSYILRNQGFDVEEYGASKRLDDLGRDLIAKKGNEIYIIQCKRWAKGKFVHENVICQLYGSSLVYEIDYKRSHPHQRSLFDDNLCCPKVIPVLYTTSPLTETAKDFAEKLGVMVFVCPMGDYPMIKCNIGENGEKIYHLPFDLQYYNTKIDGVRDFYVKTVQEAVTLGYRRAFRWKGEQ